MGFRFRKSFGVGPFRTTISKSGISFSAGVKGARITKKANGNTMTTVGIPGTGVSYTKESSNKKRTPTRKEREKAVIAENQKKATHFYDLIPFDNLKDKMLFMLAWYATIANKFGDDYSVECELADLDGVTFKIGDINAANKKFNETDPVVATYTSNHLSAMVEKGWFIRESRGVYKIDLYKILPYVKQIAKG